MYHVQYSMDILPINYVLDLRKLSVLHKQSVHHRSSKCTVLADWL